MVSTNVLLTKKEAQQLLQVSHPRAWRSHLEAVGCGGPQASTLLSWADIEALLALQLFLRVGLGKHSKADFRRLYQEFGCEGALRRLAEFDIDLQLESAKLACHLQDRVYDKQRIVPDSLVTVI